jgi:hypothetical protein
MDLLQEIIHGMVCIFLLFVELSNMSFEELIQLKERLGLKV